MEIIELQAAIDFIINSDLIDYNSSIASDKETELDHQLEHDDFHAG